MLGENPASLSKYPARPSPVIEVKLPAGDYGSWSASSLNVLVGQSDVGLIDPRIEREGDAIILRAQVPLRYQKRFEKLTRGRFSFIKDGKKCECDAKGGCFDGYLTLHG